MLAAAVFLMMALIALGSAFLVAAKSSRGKMSLNRCSILRRWVSWVRSDRMGLSLGLDSMIYSSCSYSG